MAVIAQDSTDATAIRPFTIDIPGADLDDLRARIAATRWPERETVEDESQGVPLALMQDLARYPEAIDQYATLAAGAQTARSDAA
jgi:hypothetical protein